MKRRSGRRVYGPGRPKNRQRRPRTGYLPPWVICVLSLAGLLLRLQTEGSCAPVDAWGAAICHTDSGCAPLGCNDKAAFCKMIRQGRVPGTGGDASLDALHPGSNLNGKMADASSLTRSAVAAAPGEPKPLSAGFRSQLDGYLSSPGRIGCESPGSGAGPCRAVASDSVRGAPCHRFVPPGFCNSRGRCNRPIP